MKKLLLIFLMATCFGFAEEEFIEKDTVNKNFNLFVSGSIGPITSINDKEIDLFTGYYLGLGMELPLSNSFPVTFEIFGHSWIMQRDQIDLFYGKDYGNYHYEEIGNDKYMQIGFELGFKFYLFNLNNNFNLSANLGKVIYSATNSPHYYSYDFGIAVYYKIIETIQISIARRYYMDLFTAESNASKVPNPFLIVFVHKFKW